VGLERRLTHRLYKGSDEDYSKERIGYNHGTEGNREAGKKPKKKLAVKEKKLHTSHPRGGITPRGG